MRTPEKGENKQEKEKETTSEILCLVADKMLGKCIAHLTNHRLTLVKLFGQIEVRRTKFKIFIFFYNSVVGVPSGYFKLEFVHSFVRPNRKIKERVENKVGRRISRRPLWQKTIRKEEGVECLGAEMQVGRL